MRVVKLVALMALLLAVAAMAADEKPWLDGEKCAFCKEVMAQPGLAEHMHHEYHNIARGIVSVSYIDEGYWDEFDASQAGMQKVIASLQSGEMPQMCQHCTLIGKFAMSGVKMEEIRSEHAVIVVYQSSDTAMVAELQQFGKRTSEEFAKLHSK